MSSKSIDHGGWRWRIIQEQVFGTVYNALGDDLPHAEKGKIANIILLGIRDILENEQMARKTYSIDVKVNFDDESRHEQAMALIRKAARTLKTQMNLLADGRTPQVAIRTEDLFEGVEDIPLEEAEVITQT